MSRSARLITAVQPYRMVFSASVESPSRSHWREAAVAHWGELTWYAGVESASRNVVFMERRFAHRQCSSVDYDRECREVGLHEEIGSLEPGKIADFIVLEKNPLDDILNTLSLEYTIQGGVVYDSDTALRVDVESVEPGNSAAVQGAK